MPNWLPQMESLIAWFEGNRDRLPRKPFKMSAVDRVVDTGRFYDALERDIVIGPEGPRAFSLEQRLMGLQRVVR